MLLRITSRAIVAALLICCGSGAARGDGWGSLKGRFVYDGPVPPQAPLNVVAAAAMCGNRKLMNESLVVAKDGSVANVVVWLRTSPADIHSDYQQTANANVQLDNKNCRFEPHVLGICVGQTLVVTNSDNMAHNTKIDGINLQINPLVPAGGSVAQLINGLEPLPAVVSCSIHNWMNARLVVRPDPYFAVSDVKGNFEIKNLPPGKLEFQVWHEQCGYVTKATVDGQAESWVKGRPTWTIEKGKTKDLGNVKIKP